MTEAARTKVAEGCDPDDKACTRALLTLVDEVMRHRRIRAAERTAGVEVQITPAVEIMETRWPDADEKLVLDPIMEALHQAVRRLGKYLHRTGGTDRMERVLELACGQRPRHYAGYAGYVDHRWNGTGGQWWA